MRTGAKDKEDIIPRLLLKVDIPPPFALCIATLHFNKAVHSFANVLGVSRIGNLRSIFKKGVIIAHLFLTLEVVLEFETCIRCVKANSRRSTNNPVADPHSSA